MKEWHSVVVFKGRGDKIQASSLYTYTMPSPPQHTHFNSKLHQFLYISSSLPPNVRCDKRDYQ